MDDAAGEVEGDEGFAGARGSAKEGERATGDPGGPEPVDGRELVRGVVQGAEGVEGVVVWEEGDEGVGELATVLESLGGAPLESLSGAPDEGLGVGAVDGAVDAAEDGAPGLVEAGGGGEFVEGLAGEAVDDGLPLGLGVHGWAG